MTTDPVSQLAASAGQVKDAPIITADELKEATGIELQDDGNSVEMTEWDKQTIEKLQGYIVDPLEDNPYTKVLLYGGVGAGKTKAACTAPKPLLIAIERGQSTLYNHPEILAKGIKVMKFISVQQVEDFADMLKRGYFPEFETIILDTFSELQYVALDNRVVAKWQQSPGTRDPYTPEGKDYQGNTQHMRRIAAAFRDIDRNVVFVCHSKDEEVGTAKAVVRRPSPTPQVNDALNQYVDVMAYMYNESTMDADGKQEEHFFALTRNTQTLEARILAKTRIKSLPTLVEDLTFDWMHELKLQQIREAKENQK